ncbi:hypothetical protein GA0061080_10621, partial [Gilliamella intestini]
HEYDNNGSASNTIFENDFSDDLSENVENISEESVKTGLMVLLDKFKR